MKATRLFIALLLSTFFFNVTSTAQWSKITGEGPVVTKTIDLKTINSIGLGISADVVLTQGSPQKVEIKAQKNIS